MTKNKNFKRLVRQRMEDTGETYTQARNKLLTIEPEQKKRVKIPLLGQLEEDKKFDDWLQSDPIFVKMLGGEFSFILEGYTEDEKQDEFHTAIENILGAEEQVLRAAQEDIFQYYKDVNSNFDPSDEWYLEIPSSDDVWKHIKFGDWLAVKRRPFGDQLIYIEFECDCDWEAEHGLQIVLKQGLFINKIGPYDGHLTNSDAYAKKELENVVYRSTQ